MLTNCVLNKMGKSMSESWGGAIVLAIIGFLIGLFLFHSGPAAFGLALLMLGFWVLINFLTALGQCINNK